jgi:hypothetical protein
MKSYFNSSYRVGIPSERGTHNLHRLLIGLCGPHLAAARRIALRRQMRAFTYVAVMALVTLTGAVTPDEIMEVHPDGTPVHPRELKEFLISWNGDIAAAYGQEVMEAVFGHDQQAFTDAMQEHNAARIFNADGSVRDIARWRQNVREDDYYGGLLMEHAPEMLQMITDPRVPDESVQDMLRGQNEQQRRQLAKEEL